MGKIFGISNLPVSTIEKAVDFYGTQLPLVGFKCKKPRVNQHKICPDKFVSKTTFKKSNYFIKMRNGFGKLMSHFSKKVN